MKKIFLSLFVACFATHLSAEIIDPYQADFNTPPPIAGMQLVWNDEFNVDGKPNPLNWKYESGFVRNEELQWYKSDNVNCQGGLLIIEGKREQVVNPSYVSGSSDWKKNRQYAQYTSGSIYTQKLQEFQYGRYEIRARIDTTLGAWPAIWAKGSSGSWPFCGEIDILEFYRRSNGITPVILANVAWGKTTGSSDATWNTGRQELNHFTAQDDDWCNKFHVWRMDWTPDSIKLYLDDELLNSQKLSVAVNPAGSTPAAPFQQKHYFLLNLAIGANGGNPTGSPFPIKYEVDYFRVYQAVEGGTSIAPATAAKQARQITVTDIAGKVVLQQYSPENNVNLSALKSGLYIVNFLYDGGERYAQKIIKTP
jgi:beta-glucanase (GH16 family)